MIYRRQRYCLLSSAILKFPLAFPTGNETKLGMSRGATPVKVAATDAVIDRLTGAIFAFQILVVAVMGAAGDVLEERQRHRVRPGKRQQNSKILEICRLHCSRALTKGLSTRAGSVARSLLFGLIVAQQQIVAAGCSTI